MPGGPRRCLPLQSDEVDIHVSAPPGTALVYPASGITAPLHHAVVFWAGPADGPIPELVADLAGRGVVRRTLVDAVAHREISTEPPPGRGAPPPRHGPDMSGLHWRLRSMRHAARTMRSNITSDPSPSTPGRLGRSFRARSFPTADHPMVSRSCRPWQCHIRSASCRPHACRRPLRRSRMSESCKDGLPIPTCSWTLCTTNTRRTGWERPPSAGRRSDGPPLRWTGRAGQCWFSEGRTASSATSASTADASVHGVAGSRASRRARPRGHTRPGLGSGHRVRSAACGGADPSRRSGPPLLPTRSAGVSACRHPVRTRDSRFRCLLDADPGRVFRRRAAGLGAAACPGPHRRRLGSGAPVRVRAAPKRTGRSAARDPGCTCACSDARGRIGFGRPAPGCGRRSLGRDRARAGAVHVRRDCVHAVSSPDRPSGQASGPIHTSGRRAAARRALGDAALPDAQAR